MGDLLLAALLAAALLIIAAVAALAAWVRYDAPAGKGNAGQASGSPVCGEYGPGGMACDREPHDRAERHEEDGIGWRTPSWYWPGGAR